MKRAVLASLLVLVLAAGAVAAPVATAARAVIPSEVQQIIAIDYRGLRASPTGLALKDRLLSDNLKQFEEALRSVGVNPDKDVEQLVFASFRAPNKGLQIVGVATGVFQVKAVLAKMRLQKIRGLKSGTATLYPMGGGMQMAFLDDWTLLFGQPAAVRFAVQARDGELQSLNANTHVTDMMNAVSDGTVWSVLDAAGTQNMMRSALGDAAKLTDYEQVKGKLTGSRYQMTFQNGVKFDLDVLTADSMTAAMLSSLVQAGMTYRKMGSTDIEKLALENMTVDSENDRLKMHFRADDKRFQSLLHSELFAAATR